MPSQITQVGAARKWDMRPGGGMFNIEVLPDEEDFLDLNAPWKYQTPEVKERLHAAQMSPEFVDPDHHIIRDWKNARNPTEDMTGRDLYNSLAHERAYNKALEQGKLDDYMDDEGNIPDPTAVAPHEINPEAEHEGVSRDMDKAGVPGLKFLDRPSRELSVRLAHENNFEGVPGYEDLQYELSKMKFGGHHFSPDTMVPEAADSLRFNAGKYRNWGETDSAKAYEDAAKWLEDEHDAGRLSLDDNERTRNFIVFNGDNIAIHTWNGIPMKTLDMRKLKPEP